MGLRVFVVILVMLRVFGFFLVLVFLFGFFDFLDVVRKVGFFFKGDFCSYGRLFYLVSFAWYLFRVAVVF